MTLKNMLTLSALSAILLANATNAAGAITQAGATNKLLMGYWSDWNAYSNGTNRAFPDKAPYDISGSFYNQTITSNPDLEAKLKKLTVFAYDFLEIEPNGVIYFNDPNADLHSDSSHPDLFCQQKTFNSCTFKDANGAASWGHGNFEAFAQYPGNFKKVISIGGYGHDDSFNSVFGTATSLSPRDINLKNFVNSTKALQDSYKLDGVDLDYEGPVNNPAIPNLPSKYAQMLQSLRQALDPTSATHHHLSIAILANADWINGFGKNNWQTVIKNVDYIDVMTYDFHGAFDPSSEGTGYLSNIYLDPNDSHSQKFSVETAVKALMAQGVPAEKIVIGVPAYGRALQLSNTQTNPYGHDGLYQPFTSMVRGDLDDTSCSLAIPFSTSIPACTGSVQYKTIVNDWIQAKNFHEFLDTTSVAQGANAAWAYNPNAIIPDPITGLPITAKVFIAYDSTEVAKAKARYILDNHLGGMMMWEIRGDVTPTGQANSKSLLDAIHSIWYPSA